MSKRKELLVNLIKEVLGQQLEARAQSNKYILEKLSDVVSEYEAHYNDMLKTEKMVEMYFAFVMKRVRQCTSMMAQKQEVIMISRFMKEYKKMELNYINELEKIASELEDFIKKLISEMKRSG